MNLIGIALGGAFGALSRYFLDRGIVNWTGEPIIGTFAVNMIGSFLLGFLIVMIGNRTEWSSLIKDTLTIGVLASFTTFSTFTVASIHLWQSGDYSKALYNLGGSIIIGLFAAWLGLMGIYCQERLLRQKHILEEKIQPLVHIKDITILLN